MSFIGCKSNGTEESDIDAADEIDVSNKIIIITIIQSLLTLYS